MARIKTGNLTAGRPGGWARSFTSKFTGSRVSKDVASKGGVRRLMTRDPAKGTSANIGTKRDIGRFTNDPRIANVTPGSNPRVVKGPNFARNAVPRRLSAGIRSVNRSIKKS